MLHIVQTDALIAEGVLTPEQGAEIARRARGTMMALAIRGVLSVGIVTTALGLVTWLRDPASVALAGVLFLGLGLAVLRKARAEFAMLGNAAVLIGAGMLVSGSGIEITRQMNPGPAAILLIVLGAAVGLPATWGFRRGGARLRFGTGAILLMGVALHLVGVQLLLNSNIPVIPALAYCYATGLLVVVGCLLDLRMVTALAVVPYAQILQTTTEYWHAVYVFSSPEPTLSILQMAALMMVCFWAGRHYGPRAQRQAGILAVMGFITANLCFLVGSLHGDLVGQSFFHANWLEGMEIRGSSHDWEAYEAAHTAFMERTLAIPDWIFAIIWAALLIGIAFWAAHHTRRGLFNTALTFGVLHGYTQAFESFGDQPLAYVIGGLVLVPLAWGMWRLDRRFASRTDPA